MDDAQGAREGADMEGESELRTQAVRRLQRKRDFVRHLTVYVVVSVMLLVIWWLTTGRDGGYFWPIWPILGWGAAVGAHAWVSFAPGSRGFSEADIQQEMDRHRRPR
jgi:hypothetical protein